MKKLSILGSTGSIGIQSLDIVKANPDEFKIKNKDRYRQRLDPTLEKSDILFENTGDGKFRDVTESSGITNYGYGLGIAVSDLNHDGYPDIYVANDYIEPDNYYINNGDGTFTESIQNTIKHVSWFGMGSDLADFNNDGLLDIMVLDMLAEDNYRQKTMMSSMDPEGSSPHSTSTPRRECGAPEPTHRGVTTPGRDGRDAR